MPDNTPMFFSMMLVLYLFSAVNADYSFAQTSNRSPVPDAQEVQLSNERMPDGKTAIKAIFRITSSPRVVYETLRDANRFPEFMPDTREVCIVESGPGYQIAYFRGGEGLFESEVTLRREYDDWNWRIAWSLIKGRPRAVTGFWQIDKGPDDHHAVITYFNHIDPGAWIPDVFARAFIRRYIIQTAESLRKRVCSGGAWKSEEYLRRMQ
jgi:ribosome-associated toxin RatA of RatAB toxin-antitoxin module